MNCVSTTWAWADGTGLSSVNGRDYSVEKSTFHGPVLLARDVSVDKGLNAISYLNTAQRWAPASTAVPSASHAAGSRGPGSDEEPFHLS